MGAVGETLPRWAEPVVELQARMAHRFRRPAVRERGGRSLAGVLARVERQHGWQRAAASGEPHPRSVQRLLSAALWAAAAVRDDRRTSVVEHLGDAARGVLILADTGFVQQGDQSCGVARQDTGSGGETTNAQVGVVRASAATTGAAVLARARYLPRRWTDTPARCRRAGVPPAVRFSTTLVLAQRLLERALDAAVPAGGVGADACYGRAHACRRW